MRAGHAQGQRVLPRSGWFAEGEISTPAPAEARACLAGEVLRERLAGVAPLRIDLIGVASVFGDDAGRWLAATRPAMRATCACAWRCNPSTPAPSAWCAR